MSRTWTELFAALTDIASPTWIFTIALLAAAIVAALWYFYPAWVPRSLRPRRPSWLTWRWRWPRLRLPRLRLPRWSLRDMWRRLRHRSARTSSAVTAEQLAELLGSSEELPEVPTAVYQSLADALAAQGRYAEAIRERLRAAVRDLVIHQVITNRPGWTVTELASHAGQVRPAVDQPLGAATGLFSDVWYGERPATAAHDDRMRSLADEVHTSLELAPTAGGGQ